MELIDFNKWLLEVSRLSGLSAFLYFLFNRNSSDRLSKYIFLVVACISNSYIIGNTWHLVNFVFSALVFYTLKPDLKRQLIVVGAVFYIGCCITFLTLFEYTEANTFVRVFTSAFSVYFSLWLYFHLLNNPSGKLRVNPTFWIANSFFLYGSITLLKNIFANYLIFDLEISSQAYAYIHLINLLAVIAKNWILFYVLVLITRNNSTLSKPVSW